MHLVLYHVGIGHIETLDAFHVGFQEHSVNVCGGKCFFVDDGTDVQLLGHGDIVRVFDHGNGFQHAHAAGGEAREDVGLRILAGGDENFGVAHVFVLQRANVAPVAVKQKELRIGDGGRDGVELRRVALENFRLDVARQRVDTVNHRVGGAHIEHTVGLGPVGFAQQFANEVDM